MSGGGGRQKQEKALFPLQLPSLPPPVAISTNFPREFKQAIGFSWSYKRVNMSKRKWKVYTTDELRDRFQAKPGSVVATDDQKVVVPNLKRRNSAPPGMIHFPPGTFSANNQNPALAHPGPHNHSYPY